MHDPGGLVDIVVDFSEIERLIAYGRSVLAGHDNFKSINARAKLIQLSPGHYTRFARIRVTAHGEKHNPMKPRFIEPVVRLVSVISGNADWTQAAVDRLEQEWGAIGNRSKPFPFEAGGYYESQMGGDLKKTVVAFMDFQLPDDLAGWKLHTNEMENQLALDLRTEFPRPVNLDVGYLTQAKWVLATVKDRDHRIYLRDGIFAEITLRYVSKAWTPQRWSYESYRNPDVLAFANEVRGRLREYLRETGQLRGPGDR